MLLIRKCLILFILYPVCYKICDLLKTFIDRISGKTIIEHLLDLVLCKYCFLKMEIFKLNICRILFQIFVKCLIERYR